MAVITLTNVLTDDVSALIVNTNNNASALNTGLAAVEVRVSALSAAGSLTVVSGSLKATESMTAASDLYVSGVLNAVSQVSVAGTLNVAGVASFIGAVSLSSTLKAAGSIVASSVVMVAGSAILSSTLAVASHTALSATLSVTGSAMFAGPVTFSAATLFSGTATFTQGFTLSGALTAGSILSVVGSAMFMSSVNISGPIRVAKSATFSSLITLLNDGVGLASIAEPDAPIKIAGSSTNNIKVDIENLNSTGMVGFNLRFSGSQLVFQQNLHGSGHATSAVLQQFLLNGREMQIGTTNNAPIIMRVNSRNIIILSAGGVSILSNTTLGSAIYMPYISTTTSAVVSEAQTVSMGTSCTKWLTVTVSGTEYRVPLFSAS